MQKNVTEKLRVMLNDAQNRVAAQKNAAAKKPTPARAHPSHLYRSARRLLARLQAAQARRLQREQDAADPAQRDGRLAQDLSLIPPAKAMTDLSST